MGRMYSRRSLYILPHFFEIRLFLARAFTVTWVKLFFVISSLCPDDLTSSTKAIFYPKGIPFLLFSHFEGWVF